jgi:hypothetical protein
MKKYILAILLLGITYSTYSKIFEQAMVRLYVLDNAGRKDSITFGLCDLATLGIDQQFGEKDLYGTPNKDLDIRIIQRDSLNHHCIRENHFQSPPAPDLYFPVNIDSKVDFRLIDEDYKKQNTHFEIKIFAKDYPVKVIADYIGLYNSNYNRWSPIHLLNNDCSTQETVYMDTWNKNDTIFTLPDASFSTLIAIFDYEVGVKETNKDIIEINPNPATDYITLNIPPLEKRGLGGVLKPIEIFDEFGECVLSVETRHALSLQKIDISTLPAGVYFLRVGEKVEKFIKL